MRKRIISVCIIGILVFGIFGCAKTAKDTLVTEVASVEAENTDAAGVKSESVETQNTEAESEEASETAIAEEEQEQDVLEPYYGFYRISEFLPSIEWMRGIRYDDLPTQEADMLLGRIVELGEEKLVTYDSFRRLGSRDGRDAFPGNYMIEKICIEDPQYSWEPLNAETIGSELYFYDENDWRTSPYRELIQGKISIQVAAQRWNHHYYVMPEGILMSSVSGRLFYLEKLEEEPERQEERVLSAEEKSEILQKLLGTYTVVEFLPTKFYPAPDPNGDSWLPEEEAEMMIGKEITVEEDIFVSYDNFRQPNSEYVNRPMDDFWVERVDIPSPDYQIEAKNRDELYGLRDDMLREELRQDRYIEISVFPGYSTNSERCLPQLYLLDDGRIIMYAMGEYFLLEKKDEPVTVMSKKTRFDIDGSVHMWEEYEYDSAGNMTKYTGYWGSDGSFWFGNEYEYDSKNKLTKDSYCGADGEIDYWNEYEYDNAGNQVKHIRYDADGSIHTWEEYEYDSAGDQVKYISYNADGSISYWEKYEYDSAGDQVKCTRYNADNDINYWYEYEFDSMGNQTKTTEYSKRGDIVRWFEWEYDSAGNLTKKKNNFDFRYEYEYDDAGNQTKYSYYTNGSLNMWYEYEYDSMGNHTKGITYNADGSIQSIREYEYDSRGNKTKVAYDYVYGIPTGHEPEHEWEYEWEYDSMGNLTKYMEYSWGKVFDWYEYEYITITPQ